MIKVIKLGGAVLKEPLNLQKIGKKMIDLQKNSSICIVISAIGNTTDELYTLFTRAAQNARPAELEEFVGYGEIISAKLFTSVLKSIGCNAMAILPHMKEWPLWVSIDRNFFLSNRKGNQERKFKVLKKSKDRIEIYILPLLKDRVIPVIPGFIAKTKKGDLVTLGRGGSDVSAFLIAELLKANEVILVKEVSGVLTKDPNLISSSRRKIKTIPAEELGILTHSGARILHPSSLKQTLKLKKARIVSSSLKDWSKSGTKIFFGEDVKIKILKTSLSVLTFLGKNLLETPGILSRISRILAESDISIYGITLSESFLAIYVKEEEGQKSYSLLHSLIDNYSIFSSLSLKEGISKITISSLKFIDEPGIIEKITGPVAQAGINIWEVVTVHTEIALFVEKENLIDVSQILRKRFERRNDETTREN